MTGLSSRLLPGRPQRRAIVAEAGSETVALCRNSLESAGFAVAVVASGVDALSLARREPPDVILLGEQLRDVSAQEAVGWLRANPSLRSTPIIILTTNAESEQNLGNFAPGVSLRKPILPRMIQRTLTSLLDK